MLRFVLVSDTDTAVCILSENCSHVESFTDKVPVGSSSSSECPSMCAGARGSNEIEMRTCQLNISASCQCQTATATFVINSVKSSSHQLKAGRVTYFLCVIVN